MKAKITTLILAFFLPMFAFASVEGIDSSGKNLGHFNAVKCSSGVACTNTSGNFQMRVYGAGTDTLAGFLSPIAPTVASITGDLSITNCGATMTSDGSVVAQYNLPPASSAIGCTYSFIVGVNQTVGPFFGRIRITPKSATDQIFVLTDEAGESITGDVTGTAVTLRAISAGKWAPISAPQGTWNDVE